MTPKEFVAEFEEDSFPRTYGPWITFDSFDPPFKRAELRDMRKLGLIEIDEPDKKFRLTFKALEAREKAALDAAKGE